MKNCVFPSYAAALAECGYGYEDHELSQVIYEKTVSFPKRAICEHTIEWLGPALMAFAYAARMRSKIHVLDFGGQFGLHYDALLHAFPDIGAKWAVVETKSFVERASVLTTSDRRWFTDLNSASTWLGSIDLLICSGALQYMPDPAETLIDIISKRPPLILWQRMALTHADTAITVVQTSRLADNGPGPLPPGRLDREVRHPLTYLPIKKFLDAHADYQNICRLNSRSASRVGDYSVEEGSAFFFRCRDLLHKSDRSNIKGVRNRGPIAWVSKLIR